MSELASVPEPSCAVETVCNTCVFAIYDVGDSQLQTGCLADRLKKYVDQGVELIEYEDKDGNKFFGIPNKVCTLHRNKQWLANQPEGEHLVGIARDEVTLRMDVIIYIGPDDEEFQSAGKTTDSLAFNKLKPNNVIYCDHKNIKPSTFRKWAEGRCTKMGWRAEHIRESKADALRCIDICMKRSQAMYVAVFRAGFVVPDDFISQLDVALNDELERFLYLTPHEDDINGMVLQKIASKNFHGNRENPLIDKLRKKALEQECPEMIRPVTDLVPSMKRPNSQRWLSLLLATTQESISKDHSKRRSVKTTPTSS